MTQYIHTASHIADYYPFGMEIQRGFGHTQPPAGNLLNNRYLYNSKEFQDDFGLNWYDYGARFYDAQISRFHSIDPLAANYAFQSPYVYAANDPILHIDYMGMGPISANNNEDEPLYGGTLPEVVVEATRIEKNKVRNRRMISGMRSQPRTTEPNFVERAIIDFLFLSINAFVFYDNLLGGDPESTLEERLQYATLGFLIAKVKPPKGLISKPSKKGRGIIFQDPKNTHNSIRIMRGNPSSPNPAQRKPYVLYMKDGKAYNANGIQLPNAKSPDAHIPVDQFDIRKMPKF